MQPSHLESFDLLGTAHLHPPRALVPVYYQKLMDYMQLIGYYTVCDGGITQHPLQYGFIVGSDLIIFYCLIQVDMCMRQDAIDTCQ